MGEVGTVIETDNDFLTVKLVRTEACAKCRACAVGSNTEEMIIKAKNMCDATINDSVNIELRSEDFLKAVLIMYGIPFLSFISGVALGIRFTTSEIIAFFIGIFLMLTSYLIIKRFESYINSKNYIPMATQIVTNGQPPL